MIVKVIPPDAWGADTFPPIEVVKSASTGLRGHDLAGLLKRASHPLARWVQNNPPAPGEVYLHCIAMGSTERFGPNRNFDGWTDRMLSRDHGTFEKHARWYLNHKSDNPAKSYGRVPKAFYSPDVQRVEVIAALNGTKQAAERNGNLVAERTLNKVASGLDVAISMAAKIPYDQCVLCGHQAKGRHEYCTPVESGGTCKYAGCREHLGRVYDDGKQQFVDNPSGVFFDLSDVSDTRGADRTAFITGKVAGHYTPGGAELAELMGLVAPEHLLEPAKLAQLRCLRKLAEAAARPHTPAPDWHVCVTLRQQKAAGSVRHYNPRPGGDYAVHATLADLAADGVLLPPADWAGMVTGTDQEKCAAIFANAPDPQRDLLDRTDLHDRLLGAYSARENGAFAWLAPTAEGLRKEAARGITKAAFATAVGGVAEPVRAEFAARYLAYQAAVLAAHENSSNFTLLLADAARHTRAQSA